MKKLTLLLIFLLLATLAGCLPNQGGRVGDVDYSGDTPVTRTMNYPAYTEKDGSWAIYLYIVGSDLESDDPALANDPYGIASGDMEEIASVALPGNVNVITQTGGAMNWAGATDPSVLGRTLYGAGGASTLEAAPLQYVNALSAAPDGSVPAVEPLSPVTDLGLDGFPVTLGPDGHWQLELGPERAGSIAAVHNYMLWDSGGTMQVLFGVGNEVQADWQNGLFTENYTGRWGCLDDAQVFMRAVVIGDGYVTYACPILLNGAEYNLFVSYTQSDGAYTILGVRQVEESAAKDMREQGPAAKDLLPLQAGDVVEPIHYFLLQQKDGEIKRDAFPVQSITIGDDPQFYEKNLGDGHFQMMFSMIDYAGKEYFSSVGDFRVKEGRIERVQGWEIYPQPAGSIEGLYVNRHTQGQQPYYTVGIDAALYIEVATQLGIPNPESGDQMSGGGYTVELFTNDPSIHLADFVAERVVYMTGRFIDGRAAHQRDIAFEVTGIMAGEGPARVL